MTFKYTAQVGFRGRSGDTYGLNVDNGWAAGQNANWIQLVDTVFRVRFEVEEQNNKNGAVGWQLQYNLGGAGWNDVTTSSSVVRAVTSGQFNEGDPTSNLLTASAKTFVAGEGVEDGDGTDGTLTNTHSEYEYSIQIQSGDVSDENTIQLQIAGLDGYPAVPTITVDKPLMITNAGAIPSAEALGQPKLSYDQTLQPDGIASAEALGQPEVTIPQVVSQAHFRFRDDAYGLNVDNGWLAALDGNAGFNPDKIFRVRFEINVTGAALNDGFQLRAQYNGAGGYQLISNNATPFGPGVTTYRIACVPSSQYDDPAATTDLLTGITGNFTAGNGNEDNTSPSQSISAGNHTEQEWAILVQKLSNDGHTPDGAYFDLRVYLDDGTPLDAYTNTARVTVTNWDGHIGGTVAETPYESLLADGDGCLYYLCEYTDTGASLGSEFVMMKSADGGTSWNPQDESNRPSQSDLETLQMVLVGDVIYLICQGSGDEVYVHQYNVSTHSTTPDTWGTTDSLVKSIGSVGDQGAHLVRRTSDFVAAWQDDPVSSYEQVHYRTGTPGSWNTEQNLDTTSSTSFTRVAMCVDSNNDTHIVYYDLTNTDYYVKKLTSADSLGSRVQIGTDGHASREGGFCTPVVFTYSSTEYVGVLYYEATGDDLWFRHWTASGMTMQTAFEVSTRTQNMNAGGSAALNAFLAVDPATQDIYAFYVDDSTMDIYYRVRSGSTGSWGDETLFSAETDLDWIRGLIFTHSSGNGGNKVVGFYYDGGEIASGGGTGCTHYTELEIESVLSITNAGGITSAESLGQPEVVPDQSVYPDGIASAEAFGQPEVVPDQSVYPDGIATAESFGQPDVFPDQSVYPDGIASAESFGSPQLSLTVLPNGISSAEVFGQPDVFPDQSLAPDGIASAESLGQPQVTPGAVTLLPDGIASAESLGQPQVTPGAVTLYPDGIASAEAFGQPSVTGAGVKVYVSFAQFRIPLTNAQTVRPAGIASAEAFGQPQLVYDQTLQPQGIPTAESLGQPQVTPGAVTVAPEGIASGESFGQPMLTVQVLPDGISSGEALGQPQVTPGAVTVYPEGIASAESLGQPQISVGATFLYPEGISSGEALGQPQVTPGAVTVYPEGISSGEALGQPEVVPDQFIYPDGIPSAEAFGQPLVSVGVTFIYPEGIGTAESLGQPQVTPGVVTLYPEGISSGEALGQPEVVPDQFVYPDGIASAESLGQPQVGVGVTFIYPEGIGTAESLGQPEVTPGAVTVYPDGIITGESLGQPAVVPDQFVYPDGIASAESLGQPEVKPITMLWPQGISSAESFGTPQINLVVRPDGIASAESFGNPKLSLAVLPEGIGSGESLGTPSLALTVAPEGIASGETLGQPEVTPGAVVLQPEGIASGESLGQPLVSFQFSQTLYPQGIASGEAFGRAWVSVGGDYLSEVVYICLEDIGTVYATQARSEGVWVNTVQSEDVFVDQAEGDTVTAHLVEQEDTGL